jgi:hypothetical protein
MRISVEPGVYTQLNQVEDEFIIQNLSNYDLFVKYSDTQPDSQDDYDLIIEPKCGLTNAHMPGIVWGKPSGKYSISVGTI